MEHIEEQIHFALAQHAEADQARERSLQRRHERCRERRTEIVLIVGVTLLLAAAAVMYWLKLGSDL